MNKTYDIVVAGAGSNSLTAAAYLAKAGFSVCVLEKNNLLGGGVITQEVTAPGFKHDTAATAMIIIMANPMIKDDELELKSRFGLRFISPDLTYASIFDDETWMSTCASLDKTCETIAKISQKDAEVYRQFATKIMAMGPLFLSSMFKPPLPFGQFVSFLDQSPVGQELLGAMLKSFRQVLDELFESDKVKAHFLQWLSIFLLHPNDRGTGLMFYLLTAVAHNQEECLVVGGSQKLSDALGDCIKYHGGEIRTDEEIVRYIVSDGKAKGVELASAEQVMANKAVIGCIHPHNLGKMVEGLDPDMVAEAKRCEVSKHMGIGTHWALHEAPKYRASEELNNALFTQTVPPLSDLMQVMDDVQAGRMPSHCMTLYGHHSVHDPSRAPAGKHTLYGFTVGPQQHPSGPWTKEICDQLNEWVIENYRKYTTNMGPENIIAKATLTPSNYEAWNPSFPKGDVFGIAMVTNQMLGRRPTPALSQYAVPGAEGLYLAGPFMHPGGAVTGGGRATAMKILDDMGIDPSRFMSL